MSRTRASLGVVAATFVTVATLFLLPAQPRTAVRTAIIGQGTLVRATLLEGAVAYLQQQPCVSLQAGRVTAVHCGQGQAVQAGELLFSLDTTQEEAALAALIARRYAGEQATAAYGQGLSQAFSLGTLALREEEAALQQSIEAKRVRASIDGVVSAVYAGEGEYVAAGTPLGLCQGADKCVVAPWKPGAAGPPNLGTAAALRPVNGESAIPASLHRVGAPGGDGAAGAAAQPLTLLPESQAALAALSPGQRVTVELLEEAVTGAALVPVEAVGEGDLLWLVRDGAAHAVKIDVERRNERFVAVPESLLGQRAVLLPDRAGLTEGQPVKEANSK